MDTLATLLLLLAALVLFDLAALRFGADSRRTRIAPGDTRPDWW